VFLFAGFLEFFGDGLAPVFRVMEQHNFCVVGSLHVRCNLVRHVIHSLQIQRQRSFMLAKRVNLVKLQGDYAEGCSVKTHVHVGAWRFPKGLADFLEFRRFMERFSLSLRDKEERFRVLGWLVPCLESLLVMGDFGSCKSNVVEVEESAGFHSWAMLLDEICVIAGFLKCSKKCWVVVCTHFDVFPESAVFDGLFDAFEFGLAGVEVVFGEEGFLLLFGELQDVFGCGCGAVGALAREVVKFVEVPRSVFSHVAVFSGVKCVCCGVEEVTA